MGDRTERIYLTLDQLDVVQRVAEVLGAAPHTPIVCRHGPQGSTSGVLQVLGGSTTGVGAAGREACGGVHVCTSHGRWVVACVSGGATTTNACAIAAYVESDAIARDCVSRLRCGIER